MSRNVTNVQTGSKPPCLSEILPHQNLSRHKCHLLLKSLQKLLNLAPYKQNYCLH